MICCGSHVSWDFFVRADCWSVCSQALASSRSRICLWPIAGYAGMRNGSVVFTTGRPRESHGNFADNSREDVFGSREVARCCCISWVFVGIWQTHGKFAGSHGKFVFFSREVRRSAAGVAGFPVGVHTLDRGCRRLPLGRVFPQIIFRGHGVPGQMNWHELRCGSCFVWVEIGSADSELKPNSCKRREGAQAMEGSISGSVPGTPVDRSHGFRSHPFPTYTCASIIALFFYVLMHRSRFLLSMLST